MADTTAGAVISMGATMAMKVMGTAKSSASASGTR